MIKKDVPVKNAEVLVLGFTFKENCPDVRNTKVVDIINALKDYDLQVDIYDPWASPAEVEKEYGLKVMNELPARQYEAVVLAVAHRQFRELNIKTLCKANGVLYDVKGVLECECDGRL